MTTRYQKGGVNDFQKVIKGAANDYQVEKRRREEQLGKKDDAGDQKAITGDVTEK